jgi:beta-galactosidase GanA
LFRGPVPDNLIAALAAKRQLSPELAAHFHQPGSTWKEVFGDAADEVFMAWNYANYIDAVAYAGKQVYRIPMYVNAQLPAALESAGKYPSGGPHPFYLEVWRAAAPNLDFYSPDIYWSDFEYWVKRYEIPGNAIFIPEARMDVAAFNAWYAYGEARAFGFSPFAIDALMAEDSPAPAIMRVYQLLESLRDLLPAAQAEAKTRALVLHKTSPRGTQTVALGGYLFEAGLSRSWPENAVIADHGAMLILESGPGEFYILGSGLTVNFIRDPDMDSGVAGISSVEQVSRHDGKWTTERWLNGDQTNQGRQLLMDPHQPKMYRVRLHAIPPERR